MSAPKLYVILGSHACRAAILMLDHKAIAHETITFPTGWHTLGVRLRGFPGWTVPALRLEGESVQTNPEIARFLDGVRPPPPLFPADDEVRGRVDEALSWGHTRFQMAARRLTLAGALYGRDGLIDRGSAGRLGPLLWRTETARYLGAHVARFRFSVTRAAERDLLAALPGSLDRIDAWIGAGVLNGADLNAADFVIAPSLALLTYRADLLPQVEGRPAWELLERVMPAA